MADPARYGKWFLADSLLQLNMVGLVKAYSRVYVKGYTRTIIIDSGTEDLPAPVAVLKRGNDTAICCGAAVYVAGSDNVERVISRLRAVKSDQVKIDCMEFVKVDSPDEPVILEHVLVSVSPVEELGAPSREDVATQIAAQARHFGCLFALDDHLKEICVKSSDSVKGFDGIAKQGWIGHADRELGEVVHALRRLLWERRLNTQSNHPKLVTDSDIRRAEEIWAREKLKVARIIKSIMQGFKNLMYLPWVMP